MGDVPVGQPELDEYPVYYRWYFRTGSHGDFEYLVRLLKPQPVDKRVGTRDMDVQDPGSNMPGILDAKLGGVLRLGGALRVPDEDLDADDLAERKKYENWDQPYPHRSSTRWPRSSTCRTTTRQQSAARPMRPRGSAGDRR